MSDEGNNNGEDEDLQNPIAELAEFREKWKKELILTDEATVKNDCRNENTQSEKEINESVEDDTESMAKCLFLQGVEQEKQGNVFEAMRSYRRAVQLVPDIEFKIYETSKIQSNCSGMSIPVSVTDEENCKPEDSERKIDATSDEEDLDGVDLLLRFRMALENGRLLEKASNVPVISSSGYHFSDLPTEIILFVLRWVVSTDLDLKSLEAVSTVCKGLYICARDSEIWHQACLKVYGMNIGILKGSPYLSWRQMFIERPRVQFHGCYISKTSYLRYGENSFQDAFYRPVQLVEYYRYFRFFPDGQVLMMTSADEPFQTVGKLRQKNAVRSDIIRGHYRLHNNVVIIILKRIKQVIKTETNRARRGSNIFSELDAATSQTFYIEMEILSSRKKLHSQLKWKHYSIIQKRNNIETQTEFDLNATKYPPLWFSIVKSYYSEAEQPLQ